ncbi:MAG: hypothetical protein P8183_22545, partial [Anaerolineae bacterium]
MYSQQDDDVKPLDDAVEPLDERVKPALSKQKASDSSGFRWLFIAVLCFGDDWTAVSPPPIHSFLNLLL